MSNCSCNKVAFVTGGTRGIGHDIVTCLAHEGYDIAFSGRSLNDEQEKYFYNLAQACKVKIIPILGDLANSEAIDPMIEEFKKHFSRLDLLVNNAGFETLDALENFKLSEWNKILQVNLTAPFQLSQHAALMMKKQDKGGVIINISSIHDTMPRKGNGPYSTAKAALHMLTKQCALEWAEYGIRVITVGPGAIETDMNRDAIDSFGRDKFNRWIPSGRVGCGKEVGDLVVFLASDKASYITGIDVHIDGGYLLNTVRYDDRPNRKEIF